MSLIEENEHNILDDEYLESPLPSDKLIQSCKSIDGINTDGSIHIGNGSSRTSSVADSIFARSQLSSQVPNDMSSTIGDSNATKSISEATTVLQYDHPVGKPKTVAFNMAKGPVPVCAEPMSPSKKKPKSILQRLTNHRMLKPKPKVQPQLRRKVDLIHDDWFGLAPLASPETLSEISSVCSRTSLSVSIASSLDRCWPDPPVSGLDNLLPDTVTMVNELDPQMTTPRVMRRALKVTGNLSTCADDWRVRDKYKRMGQIFITSPDVPLNTGSDSSGSNDEFLSVGSLEKGKCCSKEELCKTKQIGNLRNHCSKSADLLDDSSTVKPNGNCTNSDSAIGPRCISTCTNCPCKYTPLRICCAKEDHTFCIFYTNFEGTNTTSSSGTYQSAQSYSVLDQQNIVNEMSTINRDGIIESHFPVVLENLNENSGDERDCNIVKDIPAFNEYIQNVSTSAKSSPSNYLKRKKYIYPMNSSPSSSTSSIIRGESKV